MSRNINRKKFTLLNNINLYYAILTFLFLSIITVFYYQKNFFLKNFYQTIENFSIKYEYQYKNLNISGLNKVKYNFIESKLSKYLNSSIFLLPLDKINTEIKENNWIENVKLSTNYKDTLFVIVKEYRPLGIYKFNNKSFYFDRNGKIIDEKNNNLNNDKFIIFTGQSSNLEARNIIEIIEIIKFQKKYNIKEIIYIKKRRWDFILDNNITLMLSEKFPEESLLNYIKIEKNLVKEDMNNIKSLDLRNLNKTIIVYKK